MHYFSLIYKRGERRCMLAYFLTSTEIILTFHFVVPSKAKCKCDNCQRIVLVYNHVQTP